jgi:glycosyl transferase family 87
MPDRIRAMLPAPAVTESQDEVSRSAARRRALRHGLAIAGVIAAAWMYLVVGDATWRNPGADGVIYWAVDPGNPYPGATVGGKDAYLYSPAFAQVFSLIGVLPREVFIVGWIILLAAVAWWLARPWPASLLVLALPVSQEILIGNIHLLLAAAIVLGFRWPATWAFVLLTKVTPGVGLLWFAARREWRALVTALAATAAISAVSFVIAPAVWADWFALLRRDGGSESASLLLRLVAAAAVVVWGALTDRRWTVPLGAMLALPVIWMDSFSMLLACVALSARRPAPAPRVSPAPAPSAG